MKSVGLITEYNPLHTGHIYHMQKAKEITGADCCIAVMSGNFVQRGEPAIVNKYLLSFPLSMLFQVLRALLMEQSDFLIH